MKIGILTLHSVSNFGANLQAYSTIGYLMNNGFEPIVINWIPEDMEAKSSIFIPSLQAKAHKEFIEKYIPSTKICRTDADIVDVIESENIKGIIVGSDALFHLRPFLSRIRLGRKGITIQPAPGGNWRFPNPYWGSFIPLLNNPIPVAAMSVSSQGAKFKYME